MTHYERLGVGTQATTEEIRAAYRSLARRHHPDRTGGATSPEMLEINEAWRVLSDPILRHKYDARLRTPMPTPSAEVTHQWRPPTGHVPARFPWRFVLGFFFVAVATILVLGVFTDEGRPVPIDNVIRVGSCVDLDARLREAREVSCGGAHDAEVAQLVPFDASCPSTMIAYRDRQGLGQVCVVEP